MDSKWYAGRKNNSTKLPIMGSGPPRWQCRPEPIPLTVQAQWTARPCGHEGFSVKAYDQTFSGGGGQGWWIGGQ